MRENISIDEAVTLLSCHEARPGVESVPISGADRRVLAADISSTVNLPPFHRSAYDGFALRSADTRSASVEHPVPFPVAGLVAAGDVWDGALPEGCAIRIMTGAPLPDGADCVINFERVRENGELIWISGPLSPWQNVDQAGAELRKGTTLFRAGGLLTPAHIGVLASQGISEVCVYRKPRASVISTGSELLAPGTAPEPGKIYDSNLYILQTLLEREGYVVDTCVHVSDDEDCISGALRRCAPNHDLILTTGGASVGDKDLVPSALEHAGAEVLYARVQMKPGSCCFGAVMGSALLVSLSGNPGAALTAYYRIALPAVRKLTGRGDYALRETILPLRFESRKTGHNPRILKGHAETVEGVTYFVAHEGQKNGMQLSFLGMDALAELPPLNVPLGAGTKVRVFFP